MEISLPVPAVLYNYRMHSPELPLWIIFLCLLGGMLFVDLRNTGRDSHTLSLSEAAAHVSVWVAAALAFFGLVWWRLGAGKALTFLTAYVVEYSLSMDNLFVFVLVFSSFGIAQKYQPRVLQWGIFGAMALRLVMIMTGVALVSRFHWVLYIFGLLLLWTAGKMLRHDDDKTDPSKNSILALFRKHLPFTSTVNGNAFFVELSGGLAATPLFATLIVIEASDVLFALDSIPAVLAISQDPLIVYTSNIFAIMGLRSLYFLLAGMMGMFAYFKYGIAAILFFVGAKMLCSGFFEVSSSVSLLVIVLCLAVAVGASVVFPKKASAAN